MGKSIYAKVDGLHSGASRAGSGLVDGRAQRGKGGGAWRCKAQPREPEE